MKAITVHNKLIFILLVGFATSQAPTSLLAFQLSLVQNGFNSPVLITHAYDTKNDLYVVEKMGKVFFLDASQNHKKRNSI